MVEKAWEWIFQLGRAVNSDVIDNYLGLSMIPIRVRSFPEENHLIMFILECILSSTL